MKLPEFREWAKAELGFKLSASVSGYPDQGAPSTIGRVLGVEPMGSGHEREYGPRQQRRLRLFVQIRAIFGTGRGVWVPGWLWDALDFIEWKEDAGVLMLIHHHGGTHLEWWGGVGIEKAPIDRSGLGLTVIPWPGDLTGGTGSA